MNTQHSVPHGLLYSVAPEQFSHLHLGDDAFGGRVDWDEAEYQFEEETLASNILEFLKEFVAR